MGFRIVLLICIAVTAVPRVTGTVWEFGADTIPTAAVVSEIHGKFALFEKKQDVSLVVPPCHVITYVKVDINNYISKPMVYYNQKEHIVTIQYAVWQFSPSSFDITAKGAWIPGCTADKQKNVQDPSGQVSQSSPIQQVPQGPPVPQVSQFPPMPQVSQGLPMPQIPPGPPIRQVPMGPHIQQIPQGPPIQQVPQGPPLQQIPQEPPNQKFQPKWHHHKIENRQDQSDIHHEQEQDIQNDHDSQNEQDAQSEQNLSHEQNYQTDDQGSS